MNNAKSNKDWAMAEEMIKKTKDALNAANTGFDKAKGETENYQKDFDTAVTNETAATDAKKSAWTAAGFDPTDKSFDPGPAAGGDGKGDGATGGKGGDDTQGGDGKNQGTGGDGK